MIALIIVLAVLLIIVGVILIVSLKKKAEIQQKNNKLDSDNRSLQSMNSILESHNKELKSEKDNLVAQLGAIPVTIKDEVVAHRVLEEKIAELKQKAEALQLDEQQRKEAIATLDALATQYKEQNTLLEDQHNHLLQSIRDARKIISDIENNEFGYKLAGVNDKDRNLILILEDIAEKYNFIADDIKLISWKRVWLPRIQSIVKECGADGVMGIYKITIKKGDDLFNYIGKATNIKDRWYNHLGKMCGKENTGNETLYKKVTVNDLVDDDVEIYFSILEIVTDKNLLDETEHKWIATLGDLNIKA